MPIVNIRVWQEFDTEHVKEHLLIVGDPNGDCSNCKEIGIDVMNSKNCPSCNTEFKYIATRLTNNPSQARKLRNKRSDLPIIDLNDYKEAIARDKAHNFLKD